MKTYGFEWVIDKLFALGVPALIFILVAASTGLAGAAAITATLAILGGPAGMIGGLFTLGFLGLIGLSAGKYGIDKIFNALLKRHIASGLKRCEIITQLRNSNLPKDLQAKAIEKIRASMPCECEPASCMV